MSVSIEEKKKIEQSKKQLGRLIAECRGEMSQRELSRAVGISPSNMKYIEDGVNAPTPRIYHEIITILHPDGRTHALFDSLYMDIRKIPPPDVCASILQNRKLIDEIRASNAHNAANVQP